MLSKFSTYIIQDSPILRNIRTKNIHKLKSYVRKLSEFSTVAVSNEDITSSRSRDDDWKKKIIYNELLHIEKKRERIKKGTDNFLRSKELLGTEKVSRVEPIFVKCMNSDNRNEETKIDDSETSSVIQFPYEAPKPVLTERNIADESKEGDTEYVVSKGVDYDAQLKRIPKDIKFENPRTWQEEKDNEICNDSQFGTCDPNIPVSNVPCGGCGALLHCKDTAIPGFLPKEIFHELSEIDLRGITCQRCLFLEEYNIALGINVDPAEYPEILREIKSKKALVILMVDLLDFPCSIWPGILDIIGIRKSLVVVGNKMDLIIQDKGIDCTRYRRECLIKSLEDIGMDTANIKHIAFISAKTGYGVESLITTLQNLWETFDDTYIVGCTNVGKSTLFNTLIQSDFCKSKASDVLQRATVSQWPGTTLNLLKFPIRKPLAWLKALRAQRLKFMDMEMEALKTLQMSVLHRRNINRQTSLTGYIGKSTRNHNSSDMIGLNPEDPEFSNSKWCYDTPGVINESQILNLLTTEELAKVLPKKTIIPRNFKLRPGNALFIGGIARLDLITSHGFVWFTVFASSDLPVTVTDIKDADWIYEKLLGTTMFAVPQGGKERLKKWPNLKSKDITVNGMLHNVAAADVVLSSAGWVAITLQASRSCELRAWTPDRRGIYVRDMSLIEHSSQYRGDKIRGTPAYYPSIEVVEHFDFH